MEPTYKTYCLFILNSGQQLEFCCDSNAMMSGVDPLPGFSPFTWNACLEIVGFVAMF